MAVAAAVQSGSADAGMGVFSAAKAMGLHFIPLGEEEYDFAVPTRFLDLEFIKIFIGILKNPDFHRELDTLGGYSFKNSGELHGPY